jgi:hypothetical protein
VLEEEGNMTAPLLIVKLTGNVSMATRSENVSTSCSRYSVELSDGVQPISRQCSTERRGSVWMPHPGFDVALTVIAPSNDAFVSRAASIDISFTRYLMWDYQLRPGHGKKSHVSTQVSPWSCHASFPRLSNTDTPRHAFRKAWRKLNLAESEENKDIVNYMHVCKMESTLKSTLQHTGTLSDAAWPPRRLCYRPVVFFRHLHPVSLSFRQRKIRRIARTLLLRLFSVWKT